MTHRRSPNITSAARAWDRFVSANAPLVAASDAARYAKLVLLCESHLAAGYEWVTPEVLRAEEQQRLGSRFGGGA
jgi:hypothetical protein